jgi:hypothetical protein
MTPTAPAIKKKFNPLFVLKCKTGADISSARLVAELVDVRHREADRLDGPTLSGVAGDDFQNRQQTRRYPPGPPGQLRAPFRQKAP